MNGFYVHQQVWPETAGRGDAIVQLFEHVEQRGTIVLCTIQVLKVIYAG
jgi:hypothetical protein